MATGTVYLDVDDEITSAAARIRGSEATKVALVVPYGSRIATSRMNFRLLSREAVVNNRVLSIVATDPATRALAASAGLPVFASVAEYESATTGASGAAAAESSPAAAAALAAAAAPLPVPDEPPATPAAGRTHSRKRAATTATDDTVVVVTPPPIAAATAPVLPRPGPVGPLSQPSAPAHIPVVRGGSRPRIGAPVVAVAALVVLALVVVGVGAYVFLPSAQIVVTPRQEAIGPIALVVRADPDAAAPDATTNVVPAQLLDVPVEVSETFTTTGRRIEESKATGQVEFQSLNTGSENSIAKGSVVSTEGGIKFQTTASVTLPRAQVFPVFQPSSRTVGIVAVKAGVPGNVPANAITVIPAGEDPTLTKVRNRDATAGGSHEEFPQIVQEDVDAALDSLQGQLSEAFTAAVEAGAGAAANATVFGETAVLGEPTPSVDPVTLVGKEQASFELGLAATGTVIAVDSSPVSKIAETRLLANVDAGHRLVEGSVDIVPGDPTVSGGEVSFPVTAKALRVPILDPGELLALVKGRSLDEARTILAEFGDVAITAWPAWVTTIPGIDSRVTIEIVGQGGDAGDGSTSPSGSSRPSGSARPTASAEPSDTTQPSDATSTTSSPAASAAP